MKENKPKPVVPSNTEVKPEGMKTHFQKEPTTTKESERKIWPIIIFPFSHPSNISHLEMLMEKIMKVCKENHNRYEIPTIVVNNQTKYRIELQEANTEKIKNEKKSFAEFRTKYEGPNVEFLNVWSVDTCQMWLNGFGNAIVKCHNKKRTNDVFWLIPGDFYYGMAGGENALNEMMRIPEIVFDNKSSLCLGEINVPNNSAKQLIDTYGTFGLLYNWFPIEAQGLRDITSKPRTEFFAIAQEFLEKAMIFERWYGYEQTIIILLQNMKDFKTVRGVKTIQLGGIDDDPGARSSLASAMQQIERTERVLKLYWREINERKDFNWQEKFRQLDKQSEEVRGAAMTIIAKLLQS